MTTHPLIILDLETARSADDCQHCGNPKDTCEFNQHRLGNIPTFLHGFQPIGWGKKADLGLSIGCYWDSRDQRCHFFDTHTLEETVRHLVETQPLLVSFNGIAFDFPLMRALLRQKADTLFHANYGATTGEHYTLRSLCDAFKTLGASSYDLLAEIWKVDPARKFEHGLNSLDAISQANGLGAKLSHGAQAPRDWQAGRYAQVISHCQDDVYLTKALFEMICQGHPILRGDGQPIVLRNPYTLPEEEDARHAE